MKRILTARNLKKFYGTKTNPIAALNGIDMDVEEGERDHECQFVIPDCCQLFCLLCDLCDLLFVDRLFQY
jgi:hypothetical protein